MAGENEEKVAGATDSALTPPTGLTRREMREWERTHGVDQFTPVEPEVSAPIETPQAEEREALVVQTEVASLSRRELRMLERAQQQAAEEITEASETGVVAEVSEEQTVDVSAVIETQAVLDDGDVSEPEATVERAEPAQEVVPAAEEVVTEQAQEPAAQQVVEELTIAQKAAAAQAAATAAATQEVTPTVTQHKLVKRRVVRRPSFLSNRSQRDRTAAEKRRQISQRVVSVLALLACFAFALSISIPANALLTQQDVAQMKMQSFLDEQVSLASQSVDIDSDAGTTTASRDGVDVTLAAKAAPVKFYGNSGLCGEETDVNPPASGGPIGWPLANTKISSGYGYRWGSLHAGIDFEGETGTPIYATADGIVKAAQPSANNSLGICTIISHNVNGVRFDTLYGHLSSLDVGVGQSVSAGQVIGAVGSTGQSTGSHLHFEVHVNDVQIDPGPFMSNYAG